MSVIAIYNMKGGVGKTTAAVNLSYDAAAEGRRVLLWDLDPQAASSFAFRVRPHVPGFGRKCLESGHALAAAIKETDYTNLDLLPADFTYRKLDRLLDHFGRPEHVIASLLDTLGRDYDVVFLDCPAGFSLLTEGIFAAADALLVPTIPTVLSLRTVARLIKWAERSNSLSDLAPFLTMADRRKLLHRRVCDWTASHPEVFLAGQVPYASIVEQMAVRRVPLGVFAPRDPATLAFAAIWTELLMRLEHRRDGDHQSRARWKLLLRAVESLIEHLESERLHDPTALRGPLAFAATTSGRASERRALERSSSRPGQHAGSRGSTVDTDLPGQGEVQFVHRFDTDRGDLHRSGYVLELQERQGGFSVACRRDGNPDPSRSGEAQIDSSWASDILAGTMSPLEALERRLGRSAQTLLAGLRAILAARKLQRIHSQVLTPAIVGDETRHSRRA